MSPNSNSSRCAACKYLRRRCAEDCVLAPYFPPTHPERFACVHKIFGAGNVSRMLQIPVDERAKAADSIAYDAYRRVQDPVYGSVGVISHLQQLIHETQTELARTRAQVAMHAAAASSSQTQRLLEVELPENMGGHQAVLQGPVHLDMDVNDLCQLPDFPLGFDG